MPPGDLSAYLSCEDDVSCAWIAVPPRAASAAATAIVSVVMRLMVSIRPLPEPALEAKQGARSIGRRYCRRLSAEPCLDLERRRLEHGPRGQLAFLEVGLAHHLHLERQQHVGAGHAA